MTPRSEISSRPYAWTWPTYLTRSYRGGWLHFRSHRDDGDVVEAWLDFAKLGTWKTEASAKRAIRRAIRQAEGSMSCRS